MVLQFASIPLIIPTNYMIQLRFVIIISKEHDNLDLINIEPSIILYKYIIYYIHTNKHIDINIICILDSTAQWSYGQVPNRTYKGQLIRIKHKTRASPGIPG